MTIKRKIRTIRSKYHKDMADLLKECTNDYDRCLIFAEIGQNFTSIYGVRGNHYLDSYIDDRINSGYKYDTIFFDEACEWIRDKFGEDKLDEVAEYFATNNIRSIRLDW